MPMTAPTDSELRRVGRPVRAAIALGGNLGNSQRILSEAMQAIDHEPGIAVTARSPLYKTAPVGPPQPDYLNACVLVETVLTAAIAFAPAARD